MITITTRDLTCQLIKTIDLLITISAYLDENNYNKLVMMSEKIRYFLSQYDKHAALSVNEFASYLNHDAQSQLTFILGYAELLRTVNAHLLSDTALQYLESISMDTRDLSEKLRIERDIMVEKRNLLINS